MFPFVRKSSDLGPMTLLLGTLPILNIQLLFLHKYFFITTIIIDSGSSLNNYFFISQSVKTA